MSIVKYREVLDRLSKPKAWWFLWAIGALYFLYVLIFNVMTLIKSNYSLPGDIAMSDMYAGNLIFFAINIPLACFACLFAGHLALALYKTNKLKKPQKEPA